MTAPKYKGFTTVVKISLYSLQAEHGKTNLKTLINATVTKLFFLVRTANVLSQLRIEFRCIDLE